MTSLDLLLFVFGTTTVAAWVGLFFWMRRVAELFDLILEWGDDYDEALDLMQGEIDEIRLELDAARGRVNAACLKATA